MKKWLLAVAALLAAILIHQCHSLQSFGERRFRALEGPGDEILVGVCWPISVNLDGMIEGLMLARDEINSGLSRGKRLRFLIRDNHASESEGKAIAAEFAGNPEMSAVIGYYSDTLALRASAVYEESRLLHIIVGANSTFMTSHGFQYLVRTVLSNERIAWQVARICQRRGYRRYALVWAEDDYGQDLAYQFETEIDASTARIVYSDSYFKGRADFRATVNDLKAVNADVVLFAGCEPWAAEFLRVARSTGLRTPVIGAFSDTPEMRRLAGAGLEGAMYFEIYDPDAPAPENRAFVAAFKKRFGHTPGPYAAQAYDAVRIFARAVESTRSRNPLDLACAIRFMDAWQGANGRYKFDQNGELESKPIYLMQFRDHHPVVIDTSDPSDLVSRQ